MGRSLGSWLVVGVFFGVAFAFMAEWAFGREPTTWLGYGLAGGVLVGALFYRSSR
ncbi:hypothetical protein BMS3Bbin01_02964 [bacterium BMS3Bbin01]|nr:hypothetical protein BMS3Bbin01_02964 [bacterium BMS3Bbin01]